MSRAITLDVRGMEPPEPLERVFIERPDRVLDGATMRVEQIIRFLFVTG